MRLAFIGAAALLALGLAGRHAAAAPGVSGDYLEARSANIFIGACHAEGEYVTAGREAILGWNIREGSYEGVSLDGLGAVALVHADRNLAAPGAARKSVLYISSSANTEQRDALAKLIQERAASTLGTVVGVKSADLSFSREGEVLQASAPGLFSVKVKQQTAKLCCIQPYEVWYQPFVSLKDGKIGHSLVSEFKEPALNVSWAANAQNNAYFGQFSF